MSLLVEEEIELTCLVCIAAFTHKVYQFSLNTRFFMLNVYSNECNIFFQENEESGYII